MALKIIHAEGFNLKATEAAFDAVDRDDLAAFKDALSQHADPNAVCEENGQVASLLDLIIAFSPDSAFAQTALEAGSDPNRIAGNFTPLHLVKDPDGQALAELLMNHGADATRQDRQGRTPQDCSLAVYRLAQQTQADWDFQLKDYPREPGYFITEKGVLEPEINRLAAIGKLADLFRNPQICYFASDVFPKIYNALPDYYRNQPEIKAAYEEMKELSFTGDIDRRAPNWLKQRLNDRASIANRAAELLKENNKNEDKGWNR